MSKWIDADAVIARIAGQMSYEIEVETGNETDCVDLAEELLNDIPSIDIEPKRGKWEEKEKFHNADDDPIIEEWQSARCSVCHKYHTTPYTYYFDNYNFCPNCGADMREREGE